MTAPPPRRALLLKGGGGPEHDVSLVSAGFMRDALGRVPGVRVHEVLVGGDGSWTDGDGRPVWLRGRLLEGPAGGAVPLDYAVPCVHGPPGETGHLQALFEMAGLPFLGAGSEPSALCFNKASTKLWLRALGIPSVPWAFLSSGGPGDLGPALALLEEHGSVFVKPSSQGSSVGCRPVGDREGLGPAVREALAHSPLALVERRVAGRELESAVFEWRGEARATDPGEIICPGGFYSREEKYGPGSAARTEARARVPDGVREEVRDLALRAFRGLRLKDLARVDFFLAEGGEVLLNEVNTMPGHTPISMFPAMMEASGTPYPDFLAERVAGACARAAR